MPLVEFFLPSQKLLLRKPPAIFCNISFVFHSETQHSSLVLSHLIKTTQFYLWSCSLPSTSVVSTVINLSQPNVRRVSRWNETTVCTVTDGKFETGCNRIMDKWNQEKSRLIAGQLWRRVGHELTTDRAAQLAMLTMSDYEFIRATKSPALIRRRSSQSR